MKPRVTFVVPCYKLAHVLPECVESILAQTYGNYEVLIMDDCSPDNTPDVARSFRDARVRHIRNEENLGHLKNYNKGFELARGEYIWLISADDRLRRTYVLERYVGLFDRHPNVGYVFCPAVDLVDGEETGVLEYSIHGRQDTIFRGRKFLARKLMKANTIVAASGMARKRCYERVGYMPVDLPWGGDWYLWCAFALHFDVGYFAEAMVCYRRHASSMSIALMQESINSCYSDDIEIPWRIKVMADAEPGCGDVSKACLESVANEYARRIAGKKYRAAVASVGMSLAEFEESLCRHDSDLREQSWIRGRVYSGVGDEYYVNREFALAREFYLRALREDPSMCAVWAKWLLALCGRTGIQLRKRVSRLRRSLAVLRLTLGSASERDSERRAAGSGA